MWVFVDFFIHFRCICAPCITLFLSIKFLFFSHYTFSVFLIYLSCNSLSDVFFCQQILLTLIFEGEGTLHIRHLSCSDTIHELMSSFMKTLVLGPCILRPYVPLRLHLSESALTRSRFCDIFFLRITHLLAECF